MKKTLVYSACLLAAAAFASLPVVIAQTKPSTSQIRGPVLTDARVLVLSSGKLGFATLGSGVQLVQTPGGWELQATPQPQQTTDAVLTRSADSGWTMPASCSLDAVYRNGIRQVRPLDYSISGGAIRFTDGTGDPSQADDVVVAVCR
jgi:hypothetical protein